MRPVLLLLHIQPLLSFLEQCVAYRAGRNGKKHSCEPEDGAADRDDGECIDSRQAERAADDLRIDEVAFQLLQDNDEQYEEKCLDRRLHCYDYCSEDSSDKGSVDRDERCHSDKHSCV